MQIFQSYEENVFAQKVAQEIGVWIGGFRAPDSKKPWVWHWVDNSGNI